MIPPATIRLVHPHLENVTSEGVIIHELGHYFDEKYHFSSSKQFIKIYKENKTIITNKRQKKNILQNVLKNMLEIIKKR